MANQLEWCVLSSFMREKLNALQCNVRAVRIGDKGAILDMLAP